jgi:hypothetical protein
VGCRPGLLAEWNHRPSPVPVPCGAGGGVLSGGWPLVVAGGWGVGAHCWGSEESGAVPAGIGGVGSLLFGISIVDASIFVVFVVLVCLSGSVASYEGHMVDALASRADEGRRSLR